MQRLSYAKTNLNQQEHAGICCAGKVLIGAYFVCCYAQASFRASANAGASQTSVSNWKIDETQETLVQQWAEAKQLWFANAEADIELEYGSKIAQGAEAKVYQMQKIAESMKSPMNSTAAAAYMKANFEKAKSM